MNAASAPGRFYRWLYYRCYRYSERANRSKAAAHWFYAACYVFVIFLMNVVVLLWLTVNPLSVRAPDIAG